MSHPEGEGPVTPEAARKRVKDWWDKPVHDKKAGHDDRDEKTRNDDLSDVAKGGHKNGPEA